MKEKNIFKTLIIIILMIYISNAEAQKFFYATYQGDTINLSVNTNGSIQWQQTEDTTVSWTNIAGADTSNYTLYTSSSTTGFKYYRARILDSNICNNYYYSDIIKHRIINSTSDVQLTDWFAGGLVFYIDGAGSGLIAAESDQGSAQWGCNGTAITGADGTTIGTGRQNTIDILAGCSTTSIAAYICDTLTLNGYTDWFLPSKDELNKLFLNKTYIGTYTSSDYWSSSEYSSAMGWLQNFNHGSQGLSSKISIFKVRAIRAFMPTLNIQLDSITNINPVSATAYATIGDSGTTTVTQRGICWSTTTNPTLNDSSTISGAGMGSFNAMSIQLTANTTYYLRAFAINSVDTAYSNEQSFTTTIGTQALYDIDGNGYDTVHIGTQIWMKQNLKVTHYPNGDTIPYITTNTVWSNLADNNTDDAYCYYGNSSTNGDIYGALYSYAAAIGDNWARDNTINQGVCPDGWHLPTDAEWTTLTTYLGGLSVAGGKMKETGSNHWYGSNIGADNSSGFSALPGGARSHYDGSFSAVGGHGYWWSVSENSSSFPFRRLLVYNNASVNRVIDNKSSGFSIRCVSNQQSPTAATVILDSITNINPVSATAYATVSDSGTATVTQRGICWSTTTNPTLNDSSTISGAGMGSFNAMAIQLTASTTYYLRAFAINSVDTAYSNEQSFTTTIGTQALYDIDGNGYDTVHIGTQIWMKQNLKVTHYPNGDTIPYIANNITWSNLTITGDGFSYYNNNANGEANTYGALYNYAAAIGDNWLRDNTINQGVCPDGWHLPSDTEWTTLTTYLGGLNLAGGKMKEAGTTHWNNPNTGADNSSGFSALPGGTRSSSTGSFYDKDDRGLWWSSTEYSNTVSYNRILIYNTNDVTRSINFAKMFGMSVRCVKNLSIGDSYEGGIIAYIFVSGDLGYVAGETHGLIAAPSDQSSSAQWGCKGTSITGADSSVIGTGAQNTIDILTGCTTIGTAAYICDTLTLNGYTDWFLPSKDELNKLYLNKAVIGGFTETNPSGYFLNDSYWSSSEAGTYHSWLKSFEHGYQQFGPKDTNLRVRAIRTF